MGCGGTPGSRRSKLVPGCAAGAYTPEVPGAVARCRAPPPPPPDATGARPAGHAAVAPLLLGAGGRGAAQVGRLRFPRLRPAANIFQFPRGIPRKEKSFLPFPFLVGGFVSATSWVGDKKQNFLQKNVATHTIPQSVSPSRRFRKPPCPAFSWSRRRIMKPKTFIL